MGAACEGGKIPPSLAALKVMCQALSLSRKFLWLASSSSPAPGSQGCEQVTVLFESVSCHDLRVANFAAGPAEVAGEGSESVCEIQSLVNMQTHCPGKLNVLWETNLLNITLVFAWQIRGARVFTGW